MPTIASSHGFKGPHNPHSDSGLLVTPRNALICLTIQDFRGKYILFSQGLTSHVLSRSGFLEYGQGLVV